jgi:uncharacterized protein YunC (DUF1805 family)
MVIKKMKIGSRTVETFVTSLQRKNFILLKARRGYIMCGYLNLKAAEKFKDVAAKIVGVSTMQQALNGTIHSCTSRARKLGIHKGQPVRDTLKIIA